MGRTTFRSISWNSKRIREPLTKRAFANSALRSSCKDSKHTDSPFAVSNTNWLSDGKCTNNLKLKNERLCVSSQCQCANVFLCDDLYILFSNAVVFTFNFR